MIIYKNFDKQYFTFILRRKIGRLCLMFLSLLFCTLFSAMVSNEKNVFGSETFACLERILNPRTNPLINFSELIGCLV